MSKNDETLATLKHFPYLCNVILNPIKYWKLKRLCREHARKYNMLYEFNLACGTFGDPIEALEEWDLLNNEIIMKIQAEYNSLIDIELPPPIEGTAQQSPSTASV